MSEALNELFKSPVAMGIAVVACIIIVVIIFKSRSENFTSSDDDIIKETFVDTFANSSDTFSLHSISEKDKEIIEYFPSPEMNVMYSDANGNLATTTDLGLKNLTVSSDAQFGGNVNTGGNVNVTGNVTAGGNSYAQALSRTAGDWLRINNEGSVGRTALYGNLSVNGTQSGNSGLTVGDWSNAGEGNIKATGKINAGGIITGNRLVSDMGNWGMLWGDQCALISKKGTAVRFGHADNVDAAGWSEKMNITPNGAVNITNDGAQHDGCLNIKNRHGPHANQWSLLNWPDGNNYLRGHTVVDGGSTINGSSTINGGASINGGDTNIGGNMVLTGDNSWIFHTPDDGRKTMYIAPLNDAKNDWKWGQGVTLDNNGNMSAGGSLNAGGEVNAGGEMTAQALTRTSGDWLRINNASGSVGRTALYGNLSVNGTTGGNNGLTVGDWSNAGEGNIKATGSITASSIKLGGLTLTEALNADGSVSGGLRISNANGYVDIGAKNEGWAHIYTDRPKFAFNKTLTDVAGSPYKDYIKDKEPIYITNTGTGNHEGHGKYIGFCGSGGGGCSMVNAVLSSDSGIGKLVIEKR